MKIVQFISEEEVHYKDSQWASDELYVEGGWGGGREEGEVNEV